VNRSMRLQSDSREQRPSSRVANQGAGGSRRVGPQLNNRPTVSYAHKSVKLPA